MRSYRLAAAALFSAILSFAPKGQASEIITEINAGQWDRAQAWASRLPDPVAGKLVRFYRLQTPGAASLVEIDQFMTQNPDWPQQNVLAMRREEALADEPDAAIALPICRRITLSGGAALLHCAELLQASGDGMTAANLVRQAWANSVTDPILRESVIRQWSGVLRDEDEWARFERLSRTNVKLADEQIARLAAGRQAQARLRVALLQDRSDAGDLLDDVAAAEGHDPELFLVHAKWLRKHNRESDAALLWQDIGEAEQAQIGADRRSAFMGERLELARALSRPGNPGRDPVKALVAVTV